MERLTSLSPPFEDLRERVVETVRKHWATPLTGDRPEPFSASRVEDVSRAALDAMLTRPFRVGLYPPADVYGALLDRVLRRVRRGRPIRVSLGYGPLKNPNSVDSSRADWAEFFALCHLVAWHNKVQAIYPPGLRIRLVFDDSTLVMANRADRARMASYIGSIRELIRGLKFEPVFPCPFRQSRFSWLFHFGLYGMARVRVRRWERDPTHREQLERMMEAARRNIVLPLGLGPEEQEHLIREASHRYRVYWEALQLSGFTRGKGRLVAMYLDGSQHHLRQTVALHLTTLDKGQVTQPWQGEGVLLDNGRGKLEPFVLTAGRRPRYTIRTVDGLDLVPCAGFDRLAVAWPIKSAILPPCGLTVGVVPADASNLPDRSL